MSYSLQREPSPVFIPSEPLRQVMTLARGPYEVRWYAEKDKTSKTAQLIARHAQALSITAATAHLLTHPNVENPGMLDDYRSHLVKKGIIDENPKPVVIDNKARKKLGRNNIADLVSGVALATLRGEVPYITQITKQTGTPRESVSRAAKVLIEQGFIIDSDLTPDEVGVACSQIHLLEPTTKLAAGLMSSSLWQDTLQLDYIAQQHEVDRIGAQRLIIARELQALAANDD